MRKNFSPVVRAALLVGTFDITAAFIYYYLKTGKTEVLNVLKFVASGFFGKAALAGDGLIMLAGLLFHYIFAFAFTVFFFWIFPQIKLLARNKIITGIIYGCFVWTVMNLVVVPLSRIGNRPFNLTNAAINLLILVLCIGVPLSFMANNYYRRKGAKIQLYPIE
jgi:uncharacterized membrane protein